MQIRTPKIFTVNTPVAGNYPQGLFKYPYKAGSNAKEFFTQTLEWSPTVSKSFSANTQYTAELTLVPIDKGLTFEGTVISDITGLPTNGVEDISIETKDRNLVIRIVFKTTESENAAQLIFYDDFDGTSLDETKWELCPEWDRQGRSSWRDDMVSVSDGLLHLKFVRDKTLGVEKSNNKKLAADNWIRSGAIRTLKRNYAPLFENGYGYYEARIKFPVVRGTWGAFWLMSRTQQSTDDEGKYGAEIDIVESALNNQGKYNAAVHWNGYGSQLKSINSDGGKKPNINIYDGQFHTFALDWSPSEYVFYVDGNEFWRVDGGARFKNNEINQNPNYIKLSVEGAEWTGLLPEDFSEAEMLVDHVKVYSGGK